MIKDLIKLANHLDSKGLVKEADYLDRIIKSAKGENLCTLYFTGAEPTNEGSTMYHGVEIHCSDPADGLLELYEAGRPLTIGEVETEINRCNSDHDLPTWVIHLKPVMNTSMDEPTRRTPTHEGSPRPSSDEYLSIAKKKLKNLPGISSNYII